MLNEADQTQTSSTGHVTCPDCDGKKKSVASGVRYAPGVSGPPVVELPCVTCSGEGVLTTQQVQRMRRGVLFRKYRVVHLELGLREAASRWGMLASTLGDIESGRVETDWVPPGFVSWITCGLPISSAPRDGTNILAWDGAMWIAVRWCGWGGGIWQCSNTGHNLLHKSDKLQWWLPMPPLPEV